jgi:hypothetical protein
MKHNGYYASILLVLFLFWSCGSSKNDMTDKTKEIQVNQLKELVTSGSFKFKAESAHPMQTYDVMRITNSILRNTGNTSGRISLMGNGDHITIENDTVHAELAYFGERRMAFSTDPKDNGIRFEGKPENYVVKENSKKKILNIEFKVKSNTEQYDVVMRVYPSKRATVYISSLNRTSIRYDGEIIRPEESEKVTNQLSQ